MGEQRQVKVAAKIEIPELYPIPFLQVTIICKCMSAMSSVLGSLPTMDGRAALLLALLEVREQVLHRALHSSILQRIFREHVEDVQNELLTLLFVLISTYLVLVALKRIVEHLCLPPNKLRCYLLGLARAGKHERSLLVYDLI